MCRWLTYLGEPIYLDELLYKPENSLIHQSLDAREGATTTNGDGFGIGWYGERATPGLYRETLPAWNDQNLQHLAHQLRSPLFFAHVRASTGTATSRDNCHPFRLGPWLFMHNGVIGGFPRVRRQLESLLPDQLFNCRIGTTDSEVFFLLLAANGLEDDVALAFEKTVSQVITIMRDSGVEESFRMTAALTDGKAFYALRFSDRGIPPSLYWWSQKESLIVVSEPLDDEAEHWRAVEPSSLLVSVGHGDTAVRPFE
ncbi:MAG: class II glutamine amidotransferase [Rhodospirillales bacterium]|nr:class II glutamine amidotransferase [Rhodospirillales bacterium]